MSLVKFIGSKLLAIFLLFIAFVFGITGLFGGGALYWLGALIAIIASVYFFDHAWRK